MVAVAITGLGQRGEGVAEVDGRRVHVPFTLPGERAEIAVEGEAVTLLEVTESASERARPFCPHYGFCGGCRLQHLGPALYANFKRDLVTSPLERAGIEAPVAPLIDARGNGRRRAVLHYESGKAGYRRYHSHDLLDIDRCPILVPALAEVPALVRRAGRLVGDCDVALTACANGLDIAVRTKRRVRSEALTPLATTRGLARISLNGEVALQNAPPVLRIGKVNVPLPIDGFLQATAQAETVLAGLVLEAVGDAGSVMDLFSGIGPFALRLAEKAKVVAMDSSRPAIEAMQAGLRHAQGLKPVKASVRDLYREPVGAEEMRGIDAVVLDPPRAGAEAQVRALAKSRVGRVAYVSCDPGTFSRDAAILIGGGYRLAGVVPVDQFAFSTHVELVGTFVRE